MMMNNGLASRLPTTFSDLSTISVKCGGNCKCDNPRHYEGCIITTKETNITTGECEDLCRWCREGCWKRKQSGKS